MLFSASHIKKICPDNINNLEVLWQKKHNKKELEVIQKGNSVVFDTQYLQAPSSEIGSIFKDEYWKYYDILPPDLNFSHIYCDTAMKTSTHNDFSVFQCWSFSAKNKGIYLIDQARGKWEAPELEIKIVQFWEKHKTENKAISLKVEDKSSGTGLIQYIRNNYTIPVEEIPRSKDKVTRAIGVVNYIKNGYVNIPKKAVWIYDYTEEFRQFNTYLSHAHDDQVDPTIDAINDLIVAPVNAYSAMWI